MEVSLKWATAIMARKSKGEFVKDEVVRGPGGKSTKGILVAMRAA